MAGFIRNAQIGIQFLQTITKSHHTHRTTQHNRLLASRYQFTISERSIQNLEAAMADSDNLTQFMQATAYVRFKPDTEERSTYLYRAYTKWCEDNLESPVPQKKFSQFLLKNAGKYGLTFSKHIEGKYRGFRGVCVHPAFAAA